MSHACPAEAEPNVKPQLVGVDYDGNVGITSETAPGILSVDEAYMIAIDEKIGLRAGEKFAKTGHNHRTPSQIVRSVAEDMSNEEVEAHAREITEIRLKLLTGQIGTKLPDGATWPRFSPGFAETWLKVYELRDQDHIVDTALLSAGHLPFIRKTFDEKGLPYVDIEITDDVLLSLGFDVLSPEQRAKPAPLLMNMAEFIWKQRNLLTDDDVTDRHEQIIYVGDSHEKDGGMAAAADVEYRLLTLENSRATWQEVLIWTGLERAIKRGPVFNGAR